MIIDLAMGYDVDKRRSMLIGDKQTVLQAAEAAGSRATFSQGDLCTFIISLLPA